jgi:uncharacterized protein
MPIHARPLSFLPLGAIRPEGWLHRQLEIQRDGLSGHLDEFWPDVARSGWIGGDSEGWERGPYWLDGALPLAYLLDDAPFKARVRRWVEEILARQASDGWLGPELDPKYGYKYDPWPVFVTLKALVQYWEAERDQRVVTAVGRFLRRLDALLDSEPLRKWAQYRWGECLLTVLWLHERTGEPWLVDFAARLHAQGYDWPALFADYPYLDRRRREECVLASHVVNNAMAIKYPALWSLVTGDEADRRMSMRMMETLDRWHGQATGLFSGDEHVAGLMPSQGTELCAVVEYMYSLEHLVAATADVAAADRLERIAYNALPAAFKPDMWAHQYDQQANQAICVVTQDRIYTNNDADSNIFGLQPNFGCCTANMHQGWPKLASSLWMRNSGDAAGLTAIAYAPCTVRADVAGVPVTLRVETEYPFREKVKITVEVARAADFALNLRIPGWCDRPRLAIDGAPQPPPGPRAGAYASVRRRWQGRAEVTLELASDPVLQRRYADSVVLARGPLVYSLRVPEQWQRINTEAPGRELPHADWEVRPGGPWSYALGVAAERPLSGIRFEERPVGPLPFSPEGAPVIAHAHGRLVAGWTLERGAAAPPPASPVPQDRLDAAETDLQLIPYGCTNLRMTELPWYRRG